MKKIFWLFAWLTCISLSIQAQRFAEQTPKAKAWVDSVFNTLNKKEKIGQLFIARAHSNLGAEHIAQVKSLIKKYHIGGLCFFQGGPIRQALLTNEYQQLSAIPLMICIDGEWGLGMRLDSVINFPRQMLLGSLSNASLVYQYGKAIGNQCKRMGIHVNYAPDVDVNNNPNNPVINDRSFGEDKNKVALFGAAYMRGMQDEGVMACAKHFPGHGDVAVDSHYDLPVINKTKQSLDSLELYPFRQLLNAGVGSVMTAHLFIPAIDSTPNMATSLSPTAINNLLKKELNYKGLIFTDGLEMKGVTKFFPNGLASAQSLIAGNDMLCVPADIPQAYKQIRKAIRKGSLTWDDIDEKVKKILLAKYNLGLYNLQPIDTTNLLNDLNAATLSIKQAAASQSLTLLSQKTIKTPLTNRGSVAYIALGAAQEPALVKELKEKLNADIYSIGSKASFGNQLMDDKAQQLPTDVIDSSIINQLIQQLQSKNYQTIVIGLHNYSRRPANNFGLNNATLYALAQFSRMPNAIICAFGNPYAIKYFCNAPNVLAAYEDDATNQIAFGKWLVGEIEAKGVLPVSICENFPHGFGITQHRNLTTGYIQENVEQKLAGIDTIVQEALKKKAFPGCVVLAAHKKKLIYQKSFGYTTAQKQVLTNLNNLYDLASITKTAATTLAIMKLYEGRKLSLTDTLGKWFPLFNGTSKAGITVKELLTHEGGLVPFIPFYKYFQSKTTNNLDATYFSNQFSVDFSLTVSNNLFAAKAVLPIIDSLMLTSKTTSKGIYVYSDMDFILLGRIVEQIAGKSLDEYVKETFYNPLQLASLTFRPATDFVMEAIVPTENDLLFRNQLIHGYVHDEGAALMGGIAGHAGLFGNAYDLAYLYQLLLNNGNNGLIQILQPATIQLFTSYAGTNSRRGLGFDKPEKNNAYDKNPYPCFSASTTSFGHTGFTGTCVWADPENELVFVFLSNRVHPTRNNNLLSELNIRSRIFETLYAAIK